LEAVFPVQLIVGDFEGALNALFQQMADALEIGTQPNQSRGEARGGQRPILPLKIIFRRADKIKDPLDRSINGGIAGDVNHFSYSLDWVDRRFDWQGLDEYFRGISPHFPDSL